MTWPRCSTPLPDRWNCAWRTEPAATRAAHGVPNAREAPAPKGGSAECLPLYGWAGNDERPGVGDPSRMEGPGWPGAGAPVGTERGSARFRVSAEIGSGTWALRAASVIFTRSVTDSTVGPSGPALVQQVGVRGYGAPEGSDVHDVVIDVDDLGHGANLAGAASAAGSNRLTAAASVAKKSRSRVSRSTSPLTTRAAPPAGANPSASGTAAMTCAIRSWRALSTPGRGRGVPATIPPRPAGRAAKGGASATSRSVRRHRCSGGRRPRSLR